MCKVFECGIVCYNIEKASYFAEKEAKADTLKQKELKNEGWIVWLKLTYSVKCIPVKKNSGKKKRVRRQT